MAMINGKRVVAAVLALVLITGLCGCVNSVASIKDDWFDDSIIVNTELTREALSENPVISAKEYHPTILDWVDLFIKDNYASSAWGTWYTQVKNYSLSTLSGDKEYFSTLFCYTEFESDIAPEGLELDGGRYQIRFQMVIQTSETYYEGPFTLIGFVTNQDRQIVEPRELYDFIKGMPLFEDTDFIAPEPLKLLRLDAFGSDFTETKADDVSGLSVINLRSLTGGSDVEDFTFFPGDFMALLTVNPDIENEKVLMVFQAEDLRFLYQQTFSDPDDGYLQFETVNGTLALVQTPDREIFKYFVPTESGVSEIPEPIAKYRLSDTAFIVEEKNCLYLEQNGMKNMLLEGFYPENPEDDDTGWENYHFYCRISDTRFIYEKFGYEWYDECGIYDIATGEKTVFEHENASLLNIRAFTDGKAILTPDEWSSYQSYGPYLYDEATGELIDLNLLDMSYNEVYPRFCLFGNTLAVFIEDEPISTFSLFNLSSKTEIVHNNILYTRAHYYFSSGLWATENYIWFNSTAFFPEDYLLRIPIER